MRVSSLTADLTHGPLRTQILVFSLPLMLSNILQVLFNMSDIAVVGRFAGAEALGSVGSTAMLVTLFTTFLIGVGAGINVVTARFLGERNYRAVNEAVHTACVLSLIIGLVMFAFGQAITRPILELLGTKDVLIGGAERYLRVYWCGLPALALFNFGSAVLSASGDTRNPLYILMIAGALNILLNLLFVIAFGMGVIGVGLASALSQCLSAVLVLYALTHKEHACRLDIHSLRVVPGQAREILRLGLSSGFQNAVFYIANLFIQAALNTFDAVTVEGASAAANADSLLYDMMAAVYTACASFMSQNLGARDRKRTIRSFRITLCYSFGSALLVSGLLLVFGRQFLALFTTEAAVIDAGMLRLRVMAMSYAFSAFMDNTIAASRGIGKTAVPTVMVILGSCVFRVLWICTVFRYFHTVESLYLLYIFSWAVTAIGEFAYFLPSWRKVCKTYFGE